MITDCQNSESNMRYFLDAEYNGFRGPLISLALVSEEQQAPSFMRRSRVLTLTRGWPKTRYRSCKRDVSRAPK